MPGGKIDIKRSQFYRNAGNDLKTTGHTTVDQSLIIAHCTFFRNKPFAPKINGVDPNLHCRAGGGFSMTLLGGSQVLLQNSIIAGEGDCLAGAECRAEDTDRPCNGTESMTIRHTIFRGYRDFGDPQDRSCLFMLERDKYRGKFNWNNNIYYGAKVGEYLPRLGKNDLRNIDPLFKEKELANFDGILLPKSPAIKRKMGYLLSPRPSKSPF
jgi:hypothetical protein